MSGRRRSTLAPSLFPFLAVLVCTLGTLILLLALVAQNAMTAAEREAAEKAAEKLAQAKEDKDLVSKPTQAQAQQMIDEGAFRVAQLVSFRNAQTADLENRRDRITHLEDHIQRVREELSRLSQEVELATSSTATEAPNDKLLAELKAKLETEKSALGELRESSKTKKPRVVIVPHKGPNGTDRRPVYLECTATGLTIWPESSRIEIEQLLASEKSANPLDAALRTVRLYVMQNYGDSIPPYPLLVVRPDGIETYLAARQSMLDWDDQFGYELVPADVDLAFAKPDPQLKQKVDVAIREAAAKQSAMVMMSGIRSGGNGGGGRVRTLSAANLDQQGRSGGFSDHRDLTVPRSNYSSAPSYATADGGESSAAKKLDDHLRSAASEIAGTMNGEIEMPGFTGDGSSPGELGVGPTAATKEPGDIATRTADAGSFDTTSNSRPNSGFQMPNGTSLPNDLGENSDDSTDGQFANGAKSGGGDGGTQMQGGGSPMASSSASGGQSSTRGSSDDSQPSNSVSVSNSPPPKTPPPQSTRKSLQRKGEDWALPSNVAGIRGTAVVRTIRVVCYSDRLVLLPPISGGATEMFGFSDGEINRATLELAAAVRDRIEAWGPSLPGGRWQPRLDVEVSPDGVTRFEQLQSLMHGSGVEVSGRAMP